MIGVCTVAPAKCGCSSAFEARTTIPCRAASSMRPSVALFWMAPSTSVARAVSPSSPSTAPAMPRATSSKDMCPTRSRCRLSARRCSAAPCTSGRSRATARRRDCRIIPLKSPVESMTTELTPAFSVNSTACRAFFSSQSPKAGPPVIVDRCAISGRVARVLGDRGAPRRRRRAGSGSDRSRASFEHLARDPHGDRQRQHRARDAA